MKNTIKKSISVLFLFLLLVLPCVFSGCGTNNTDFSITNTVDKTTVSVGDTVTYTINITNTGGVNATGLAVTDDWPVGLTYVSSSANQGSYDNGTLIWTIGNLNTRASAKLTITATVASQAGVLIMDNQVRVSKVDQTDNNMPKQIANASFTVQSADLMLTSTVDNATPNQQGTITYTVTLTNNGPADATGVTVYDQLPQGVTYVSSSTNQGSYDNTSGNWTVGSVADGASAQLNITVTVNMGTGALEIDNVSAMAYADQPDSNLNNNDATASVTVNGADLALTNGEDNTSPSVGDTVTFTVTLTNNGPLDDTGIIVTDIVPAGLTYSSSVADTGTYDATTGIWNIGSVANGGTATLTLKVTVNSGMATQTITSTAKITHSDQPDGDTSDNISATEVDVASS
ncbi:MAG: DUF11 domain-containing protein [Dehalococcoidales bacterium]